MHNKRETGRKASNVLFPTRKRTSRSSKAFERMKKEDPSKCKYIRKKYPVTIYVTKCGTSILCRVLKNFINASGFPVSFRKTFCLKKNNKLYDDADKQVPEYVRSKIPAMEDGNLVLFEIGAIINYLTQKFMGSVLIPRCIREKAVVEQAFIQIISTLYLSVSAYIQFKVFRPFFCASCELKQDECFSVAEANKHLRNIEIYLDYISIHYFRKKTGEPIYRPTGTLHQRIQINPLEPSQKTQNSNINCTSFCSNSKICSKKGLSINPKTSLMEINGLETIFTPISPLSPCQEGDSTMLERLCQVISDSDSLDAVKALIETQREKICGRGSERGKAVFWGLPGGDVKFFVVLEQLTLADVALFSVLSQMSFSNYDFKQKFPLIWHWQRQMRRISVLKDDQSEVELLIKKFQQSFKEKKGFACSCLSTKFSESDW